MFIIVLLYIIIRNKGKTMNYQAKRVNLIEFTNLLKNDPYFRLGCESIYKTVDFDYETAYYTDQVNYERGRAFSIYCNYRKIPKPSYRSNKMTKASVDRLLRAAQARFLI